MALTKIQTTTGTAEPDELGARLGKGIACGERRGDAGRREGRLGVAAQPLAPAREDALFATLRLQLGLPDQTFFTDRGFGSLGFLEQQAVAQALAPGFLREHNPIVRHTVLRRRQTLENAGLLERVGVDIHPDPDTSVAAYAGVGFSGLGLPDKPAF